MTWQDYALARQLLTEEFVGSPLREAKRTEDRQAAAVAKALKG